MAKADDVVAVGTGVARAALIAGRYELVETLVETSQSRVHRALDRATGRAVAVKILETTADDAACEPRNFAHPHAATPVDAGVLRDGRRYAVTDFYRGATLRQVLDEGLPDPSQALRWMVEVLDALAALHGCGIAHCDIKPENIVVTATGGIRRAVLLDFGFARRIDAPGDGIAGTPRYAAPEQLRGGRIGPGADLYAWALVLLECFGAAPPAIPDAHRMAATRTGPASVAIPESLRATPVGVLLRDLLESDPADRPADARETLVRLLRDVPRIGGFDVPAVAGERDVTVVTARQLRGECEDATRRREDFAQATEMLRASGGDLISAAGSMLVAAFGLRVGSGDDAARTAADAGVALLRRFEEAPRGSSAWAIGIDRGPALAQGFAPFGGVEIVSGEVFDVAAQIARSTGAGRLALSARALAPGSSRRRTVVVGTVASESGPLAVHQWKLESVAPVAARRRIAGRDAELGRLRALREDVDNGAARVALLHGPAGIGKTMLVAELDALESEASVFRAWCRPDRSNQPYSALRDMLASFDGSAIAVLRRYGLDVADARLLDALRSDVRGAADADTPEQRRRGIEDLVVELLLRTAAESPVVVVVEDLHWADPSTLQLLARLVQRLREPCATGTRLLVAATSRIADLPGWSAPHVERIEVGPIASDAAAELLALHGDSPLDRRTIALATRHSRGIPLYLDHAGRLLASDPSASLPETLEQVLAARIASLSERTRRVAIAAGAAGTDAGESLLCAVCELSRNDAAAVLDELVAAGLMLREPDSSRVAYVHELVREAVLAVATPDELRSLHRRIARILERDRLGIGFERPADLALHLELGGDAVRAAELWHRAAAQALEKAAYPEAQQAFLRAGSVLDDVPETQEILLRRLGIATGIGSAEIAMRGFGAAESRAAFTEAVRLCERLGCEAPLEVLGAIFGTALVTADDDVERILPYFDELAKRTEDPLRCFAGHQVLSVHALWSGRIEDAAAHAATAVELYRRDSVRSVAWEIGFGCHSLAYRMAAEFHRGFPDDAEAARLEMVRRVETHGNPALIAVALGWSTTLTIDTGRYEQTLEIAGRLSRICREQQLVLWDAYASLARGAALAGLGAGSDAVPPVREGLAVLDAVGVRCGRAYYLAYLARALLAEDRPLEALEAADEGVALCGVVWTRFHRPELLRLRGVASLALGRRAEARRDLRSAVRAALSFGSRGQALRALVDLVELRERGARTELAALVAALDGNGETEDLQRARALLSTGR